MNVRDILNGLKEDKFSIDEAEKLLSLFSVENIEIATLDINREKRRGIPEVIYGANKSLEELKKIASSVLKSNNKVIISRSEEYLKLSEYLKEYANVKVGKYSNTILAYKNELKDDEGIVGVITAGTSDLKVSEEAEFMLEAMNCKIIKGYDVGIAGIHRLFPILKRIIENDADVIIVFAGMEGALPSLIASLVDIPVIGIPTSVGYGFGSNGYAALASMLQSCTLGLAVMNIDNGIGAGALAAMITKRVSRFRKV
ncbi:MAG: nickel pincer cofactor biosynthesis protein LarB [Candidatus Nitrosocaldaceae archaeon]